jgi:alcohol dehydrogenase class IV
MRYTCPVKGERFAQLGRNVFGQEDGVKATEDWLKKLGMNLRLGQLGVKREDLGKVAEMAVKTAPWVKYHPRILDPGAIKELYEQSM